MRHRCGQKHSAHDLDTSNLLNLSHTTHNAQVAHMLHIRMAALTSLKLTDSKTSNPMATRLNLVQVFQITSNCYLHGTDYLHMADPIPQG